MILSPSIISLTIQPLLLLQLILLKDFNLILSMDFLSEIKYFCDIFIRLLDVCLGVHLITLLDKSFNYILEN